MVKDEVDDGVTPFTEARRRENRERNDALERISAKLVTRRGSKIPTDEPTQDEQEAWGFMEHFLGPMEETDAADQES